jgi:hypothetical protein
MKDFILHVTDAVYLKDYLIQITFNDGQTKAVDFESYVKRKGVFSPLKDKTYFKNFFIDLNTVCWPNGADVAPEKLYELGKSVESLPSGNLCNADIPALHDCKYTPGFFME